MRRFARQILLLMFGICLAKSQRFGEVCTRVGDSGKEITRGRCRDLKECLDDGGSAEGAGRLQLCDTLDFNRVVVCCRSNPAKIALKKCQEWQQQRRNSGSLCRVTIPLVRGGEEARVGEFPHMASILEETDRGPVHICGGSLIALQWVLTAAHCIKGGTIVVRLGAHDLEEREEGISVIANVRNIIVHPDFQLPKRYNDIALLQLQFKATVRPRVQPACLPFRGNRIDAGSQLVVAGWGKTGSDEPRPFVLKKAQVRSISRYDCDEHDVIKQPIHHRTYPGGITDSIICVDERDQGSCQGDSGGPLMLEDKESCGQEIVGLVSRGVPGCSETTVPGIYTRIEYFLDWIVNTIWKDEL